MDLRNYIGTTLTEIVQGVAMAQEQTKGSDGQVCPPMKRFGGGENGSGIEAVEGRGRVGPCWVEFDVPVVAGPDAIKIGVDKPGAPRLRFRVPVALPLADQGEG